MPDALHAMLAGHVERGELPGLVALVSRHGEVDVDIMGSATIGGPPMRRDTIFRIASITKPITAVATMILVEDGLLALDEPVDRLLPELADRRVLRDPSGPLDDTVPAQRAITVHDLLTSRMGLGVAQVPPGDTPIQRAMTGLRLGGDGPPEPAGHPVPDEWLRRVATLPLMYQPGERWAYHLPFDVLGVLVARAAGRPLAEFLHERVFEPLDMVDTGFTVPAADLDRFTTNYSADRATGALTVYDGIAHSQWGEPLEFHSGGGGLVGTIDDFLAFARTLLPGNESLLKPESVALVTANHLTPAQQEAATSFLDGDGWGFGMASSPARFGWQGGLGTSWWNAPSVDLIAILMTSRQCFPMRTALHRDFWTLARASA